MKVCPTCRRTYDDDGLNFCLEDGSVLTFSSGDSAAPTIAMHQPRQTAPTQPTGNIQTSWDPQNAGAYSMQPKKKSSKAWLWVLGILGVVVLLCGGGAAGVLFYIGSIANTNSSFNAARGTSNTSTSRANTFTTNNTADPEENRTNVQEIELSGWVKQFSVWGTTEYKDGEFLMAAKQKGYYYVLVAPDEGFKTENATTRVTVRNPDDSATTLGYGLIFHSKPTPLEKDYAFLIDAKKQRFRVVRHEPEKETSVTPWTNSKLIRAGTAENVLEARDKGDKIDFYINGQLATSVANKLGPTTGLPGLYSGDGLKIGFKKLEIAK